MMEFYILNTRFRPSALIENFTSLIWTERWNDIGEIEIETASTYENRRMFYEGVRIGCSNSKRVMIVDTIEDTEDEDGVPTLKVTGLSFESFLAQRHVKDGPTSAIPAIYTGTPGAIARKMFNTIVRNGDFTEKDMLPGLVKGSYYPPGDIPEPTEIIRHEQRPDLLYNAIRYLCDTYGLGFRLVVNDSKIYFDIYTGNDRTSGQTNHRPVIFSYELENLEGATRFSSIRGYKNVAFVTKDGVSLFVFDPTVTPTEPAGYNRRVLVVNATIEDDIVDIEAEMQRQGLEALRNAQPTEVLDGQISEFNTDLIYGRHYDLGDLVEMRGRDNVTSTRRVVEQIFVVDAQGERSYPTLAQGEFTNVETWFSLEDDPGTWASLEDDTSTWSDL